MSQQVFKFTREQLNTLLFDTIITFREYRDVHGETNGDNATIATIREMFQIVDADPLGIDEEYGQRPMALK